MLFWKREFLGQDEQDLQDAEENNPGLFHPVNPVDPFKISGS
jgi:hypothetical protein